MRIYPVLDAMLGIDQCPLLGTNTEYPLSIFSLTTFQLRCPYPRVLRPNLPLVFYY